MPSTNHCFREWHGVYLVKQGIYNSAVVKFKIEFPPSYPKKMPEVRFQSKIYHPLVNWETGRLNLSYEFKSWTFGKSWVINVLLFIKKMFHLEDCYNLRSGSNAYNQRALDLYVSNFAFFVAKCQDCVELSITEQFN